MESPKPKWITNSLPNKRRKTVASGKVHAKSNKDVPKLQVSSSRELTIGALEIVSNHCVLDIKTKNTNLQTLIDELNDTPEVECRTEFTESMQKFKEGRKNNYMFQGGENIQDDSWCIEKDEYVYDPHPKGMASQYNGDMKPIYPANVQPTGYEALFITLGHTVLLKEWRMLHVKNYFLDTKLQNIMSKRELNIMVTDNFGYDWFARQPLIFTHTPLSSEEEAANFDRIEQHLSELSNDDLIDYVKASNLDLREGIAELASEVPFDLESLRAWDDDMPQMKLEQFEEISKDRSLKFLPRTRHINFDPMLEAENHWLGEKLESLILMLKLSTLEDAIYIENDDDEDDDDSIVSFLADEDEENDAYWEEWEELEAQLRANI